MHYTTYFVIYLLLANSPLICSSSLKDIGLQKVCDILKLSDDLCCTADKTLQALGYGGLAAAAGTYGIPFVLAKVGFTAAGIAGGSLAAWWQSMGVAQGVFSAVQSASVTGAATSIITKIGASAVVMKHYFSSCDGWISSKSKKCDKNNKC